MRILVIDDEQDQRRMLCGFLKREGYHPLEAGNGQEGVDIYQREVVDLVLLDQKMPGISGAETLARLHRINPLVKVIMITAHGAVATAVEAMKLGALDFLEKPVNLRQLQSRLQEIAEQLLVEEDVGKLDQQTNERRLPFPVIGRSASLRSVLSLLQRVAAHAWPVLLCGETGTGKELFARLVHGLSPRHEQPFVEVNCAAIPETLFESELFGHEKGSFTGADRTKPGRFEEAQGGTLFLDEIGELPLLLQAKLLRALQEQRVQRVGSSQSRPVDVRIIAATNRNLQQMVQEGGFREDLYYRLNVFEVEIPPLRQRKDDIPELIDFFLQKHKFFQRDFSEAAVDRLLKYEFPGNVRELEHIVQRATALCRGNRVQEQDLPAEVRRQHSSKNEGSSLKERVAAFEIRMLKEALQEHDGVQVKAAETLGISERVLRYKLEKYRLNHD